MMKITAILNQDAFIPCETRSSLIDWNLLRHQSYQSDNSLNKQIQYRNSFGRINLILWYRDGVNVPFYTVDARALGNLLNNDKEVNDDNEQQIPIDHSMLTNPAVRHITNDSRMVLDLSKMTPLLRIKNVTEHDEGFYHCRVEYSNHRTFSTEIRLNIVG